MRLLCMFSILSLAAACTSSKGDDTGSGDVDTDTDTDTDTQEPDPNDVDDDGDGQTENEGDCDDANADVFTGADETCDGVDNNCSGDELDATDAATWYMDGDSDTFGDDSNTTVACEQPDGYVADNTDCDDSTDAVNPGADETCDGVDNNCSGDELDASDVTPWYMDADADSYGDSTDADGDGNADNMTMACDQPSGYVANMDDCNDAEALAWTGATEVCDGVDNDCNGDVDSDATDQTAWYMDADADSYGDSTDADGDGNADNMTMACDQPSGYVANMDDCNDAEALAWTGATEVCDGVDNNCSGDELDTTDGSMWYMDADMDGYGDPNNGMNMCDPTSSPVCFDVVMYDSWGDDWNGGALSIYVDGVMVDSGLPTGSPSICNDCSLQTAGTFYNTGSASPETISNAFCVTPGQNVTMEYAGDNFDYENDYEIVSNGVTLFAANGNDGEGTVFDATFSSFYTSNTDDCNDSEPLAWTGATEVCDGVDNDCDGDADSNAVDILTWYEDFDGDGYGDPNVSMEDCEQPFDYVDNMDDCDDLEEWAWTGAAEVCDGVDNDCDGNTDDNPLDVYADNDGDGYGDPNMMVTADCNGLSGYVDNMDDCDDSDSLATPDDLDGDGVAGCAVDGEYWGEHAYFAFTGDPSGNTTECELFFEAMSTESASNCPSCEFEFNLDITYDPTDSIETDCQPGFAADASWAYGYAEDYYGYGPSMFYNGSFMFADGDDISNDGTPDSFVSFDGSVFSYESTYTYAYSFGYGAYYETSGISGYAYIDLGEAADCDDDDDLTYPGAAWMDSETECLTDADEDGWGEREYCYTLEMEDSWGDGWNGGYLMVESNGVPVPSGLPEFDPCSSSIIVPADAWYAEPGEGNCSDTGSNQTAIDFCTDGEVSLTYTPGSFDWEHSYTLYDSEGNVLFSDGTSPQSGDVGSFIGMPGVGTDCDDNDDEVLGDQDYDGQAECDGDCNDWDPELNTYDWDADGYSSCEGDCDDEDWYTYPGAAYNESSIECLTDWDGDGWAASIDEQCFTIIMEDSFGDGWNGNELALYINGSEYATVTLDDGDYGMETICLPDGTDFDVVFYDGSWNSEISGMVYDRFGIVYAMFDGTSSGIDWNGTEYFDLETMYSGTAMAPSHFGWDCDDEDAAVGNCDQPSYVSYTGDHSYVYSFTLPDGTVTSSCELYWMLDDITPGTTCPNCEFEFDLYATYDSAMSDDADCSWAADAAWSYGYENDYYGYGPTMFYNGTPWFYDGMDSSGDGTPDSFVNFNGSIFTYDFSYIYAYSFGYGSYVDQTSISGSATIGQ